MDGPYLKRIVDEEINECLEFSGAVLIEGAKWCGKTRTAKEKAASTLFMQKPGKTSAYVKSAYTDPSILLKGDVPRLIDEWQIAPVIWDAVRFEVDERNGIPGQFILTGSAVPQDDKTRHSGTGRIARVLMRPMSLFESLESNGSVSLGSLFDSSVEIESTSDLSLEELTFALARGGWPASIGLDRKIALKTAREYVKSVTNVDISLVDGIKRNPVKVHELLRSLSRNISTTANATTIWKDMLGDDDTISDKTVASYIDALRRIFVVEDLPAWNPSTRSKTAVRSSLKRHFVDPSIAAAVLRTSPEKLLLDDFNTLELLFESLCVRDLRVYAQSIDGKVFHYRDRYDLEVDAIVQLYDGRWGAVEIKLGSSEIEKAVKNLKKLRDMIDTNRMPAPSFLMVLTADEYAYDQDGVYIVPIGCLRN